MAHSITLPVLPLRDAVVFPGMALPLVVGRSGTLRAIESAIKANGQIFAVAQRENSDDANPENLYEVGVISRFGQIMRGFGGMQLLLQGDTRAKVLGFRHDPEGFFNAEIEILEEEHVTEEDSPAFAALFKEMREQALELGTKRGINEDVLHQILDSITSPGRFADLVAGYIDLNVPDKQDLLETLSIQERMNRMLRLMERQIATLDAQEEIKTHVQEEIGGKQREIYLREQLKAIHKALGEDAESQDIKDLRARIEKLELPKEPRSEIERELVRLERAPRESMESQMIRTYLELVAELPWNKRSDDNLDQSRANQVLEEDHYGLHDVKDRVLEFLAVRALRAKQVEEERQAHGEAVIHTTEQETPESQIPVTAESGQQVVRDPCEAKARALAKGPILLFIGPPGTGKTSIARSIARSLGRKYVRVSLGGMRDEADIRGHRRTYVGAMPGRIIQGMRQAGTKNPVFLLDEIDKLGISFQGDPASALLEVLDPAQNDTFTDHYLGVPFDLSEVLFIATANFQQNIPAPLLDRMEVVEFAGYTEREKAEIAKRYLVPRILEESGLSKEGFSFTDDAILQIISNYTREAGIRQLEREIGAVGRKIARSLASGNGKQKNIDPEQVRSYLGRPRVHPERAGQHNEIGVATGMYYTPAGGDIMFVEASVRRLYGFGKHEELMSDDGFGNVSLILTGQLGDVMKESARAALTYAALHASRLSIPEEKVGAIEVHVHVPAGAIPKDGPSAGVAMATAIVSAMSERPVRRDVAMTGEITLRGRVLPIGGIKEKVLGAHRAGMSIVVLPKENEADLEDIPEEIKHALEFVCVQNLDEVFDLVLLSAPRPAAAYTGGTIQRPGATAAKDEFQTEWHQ